jgi:hypothetical protein
MMQSTSANRIVRRRAWSTGFSLVVPSVIYDWLKLLRGSYNKEQSYLTALLPGKSLYSMLLLHALTPCSYSMLLLHALIDKAGACS